MHEPPLETCSAKSVSVLTIDDHPIFRGGIRNLLEAEEGLVPLAEVGCIDEALTWLSKHSADVALLDHDLPGIKGIAGLPSLLKVQPGIHPSLMPWRLAGWSGPHTITQLASTSHGE